MRRPVSTSFAPYAGGLALAALLLSACPRDSWTTSSPEALAEYEDCLDSQMKLYGSEAIRHCERALELDPDFTAAKLRIAQMAREFDRERADRLFEEISEADLERLTPRERFLVRYQLARRDEGDEGATAVLEAYLEKHPNDPWAISLQCNQPWRSQEWDEAVACYRKLLEADPNWVIAQNHLGYIAMARGRFAEAEEQFETYRFIAPDQANPHDSLGELLTLIGRYDDAAAELEKALEVRPDFCASYEHLVRVYVLQLEFDRAEEVVARHEQEPGCGEMGVLYGRCSLGIWRPFAHGDWEQAWQASQGETCAEAHGADSVLAHSAAVRTGRIEAAKAIEDELEARIAKAAQYGKVDRDEQEAMLAHMRGTRLEREGDLKGAVERYNTADRLLRYWTAGGLSYLKLYNQLSLAMALRRSGDTEGEEAVLRRVRSVNPQMEKYFYPMGSGRG